MVKIKMRLCPEGVKDVKRTVESLRGCGDECVSKHADYLISIRKIKEKK